MEVPLKLAGKALHMAPEDGGSMLSAAFAAARNMTQENEYDLIETIEDEYRQEKLCVNLFCFHPENRRAI